MPFLQKAQFC